MVEFAACMFIVGAIWLAYHWGLEEGRKRGQREVQNELIRRRMYG